MIRAMVMVIFRVLWLGSELQDYRVTGLVDAFTCSTLSK